MYNINERVYFSLTFQCSFSVIVFSILVAAKIPFFVLDTEIVSKEIFCFYF